MGPRIAIAASKARSAAGSIAGPLAPSILIIAAFSLSTGAQLEDESVHLAPRIIFTQMPASALSRPPQPQGGAPARAGAHGAGADLASAPSTERSSARNRPGPGLPHAVSTRESFGLSGPLPSGTRIVLYTARGQTPGIVDLTPDFDAAGRPDLSFDGQRILFVGRRRPGERTGIWEMDLDRGEPRLVLQTRQDCTRAIYLSTIYTLSAEKPEPLIAFSASRASAGEVRDDAEDLYTCSMDGSRVRRITFNPYGSRGPLLLSDGRLLHESARPGGGSGLLTVNVDGTDLFGFAGQEDAVQHQRMPCETSDGHVVFIEGKAGSDALGGGSLVSVMRSHSSGTRRPIASDSRGFFLSPTPLPDGRLLVSYRSRSAATYGIGFLDPSRGSPPTVIFDDPDWHDLGAIAVQPRQRPAGRSSVVNETVGYGFLYCLDAAETVGPRLDRRRIARLRVLAAEQPQAEARADAPIRERLLGEVPIEADGSFSLQVPTATPLRLETLDQQGGVLAAMHSWVWVMPMERRGCIGCHEDPNLTPPNRFALALRAQPRRLGLADSSAVGPGDHAPDVGDYP